MSRISESALLRLDLESSSLHSGLPFAVCSAISSPEAKAVTTASPEIAGLEAARMRAGSTRAWWDQPGAPVAASKVIRLSAVDSAKTRPFDTVGAACTGASVGVRQITLPVLAS